MKLTATLVAALFVVTGFASTGTIQFAESWEIIEFRLVGMEGDTVCNEKTIRVAGVLGDMKFSCDGKFRTDFNMRTRSMIMEYEEGTWQAFDDSFKIGIVSGIVATELNYTCTIENDILVLLLRSPQVETKLNTKFSNK